MDCRPGPRKWPPTATVSAVGLNSSSTPPGSFAPSTTGGAGGLVTPGGHAFISWGVNHYHAGWWAQDYNLDYWLQRFGAEKVDDPAWNTGFCEAALADLSRLGLNTLGIHTNATMLTHPPGQARFPFVAPFEPLVLSHYLKPQPDAYADIFAPEFEAQCERTAQRVAAPYRDDPMVLGYCMADCPPLTDNEAEWNGSTTWPRRLRNFAGEAPGKQAYVDCMRERRGDMAGFNATYGTRFAAWPDLLSATDWEARSSPRESGGAR